MKADIKYGFWVGVGLLIAVAVFNLVSALLRRSIGRAAVAGDGS